MKPVSRRPATAENALGLPENWEADEVGIGGD